MELGETHKEKEEEEEDKERKKKKENKERKKRKEAKERKNGEVQEVPTDNRRVECCGSLQLHYGPSYRNLVQKAR